MTCEVTPKFEKKERFGILFANACFFSTKFVLLPN